MKVARDFYENILDQKVKYDFAVLPFMEILQFICNLIIKT